MKHKVAKPEDPAQGILGETICGIMFSDPHLPKAGETVLASLVPGVCTECFSVEERRHPLQCPECGLARLIFEEDDLCMWCEAQRDAEVEEDQALAGDSYRIRL